MLKLRSAKDMSAEESNAIIRTLAARHPTISVIPETDWEGRLCEIVCLLRSQRKDAIILYDYRTNTLRIFDGRAIESLKAT